MSAASAFLAENVRLNDRIRQLEAELAREQAENIRLRDAAGIARQKCSHTDGLGAMRRRKW